MTECGTRDKNQRSTVGVIVIGDEVLSRKVHDANTPAILDAMARHGVDVGEVAMLPDVLERIAAVVADFSARFDFVVTTGGVGPTHDDRTWESVAAAFGEELTLHEGVWRNMQQRVPGGVNEEQKRMAMLPPDVQIAAEGGAYLFWSHNVYVMPGIPAMVHKAIEAIALRYKAALRPLATVYFTRDEWHSVAEVDRLVARFTDLQIGSYPVLDSDDHRHRVTIEGEPRALVEQAVAFLVEAIGEALLVRVTWREDPGRT